MSILQVITIVLFLFPFLGFLRRDRDLSGPVPAVHRKTVAVIPAHNEERVIANIVGDCIDTGFDQVVVVADRCTDGTVERALGAGADRIERVDCGNKALALNVAFPRILQHLREQDVIYVFDADNRIAASYLSATLGYFNDHAIVQTYVRNLNTNSWVARMYLIMMGSWARFQDALTVCHGSNILAGTGWGITVAALKKYPQDCRTVTEDLEYTGITRERVYFVRTAEVLDEKPTSFRVSVRQRLRWVRGAWQVILTRHDYDPAKLYVPLVPVLNTFFLVLMIRSWIVTPVTPLSWLLAFVTGSVLDMFYYMLLLDRRDLARVSVWDLLTYGLWCYTNYPIVIAGILTWNVRVWHRTPHTGGIRA